MSTSTPTATPVLLTAAQLGKILGLAQQTIYNRLQNGADLPPAIRVGRLPRFFLDDVHTWLNAKRASAAPAPALTKPVSMVAVRCWPLRRLNQNKPPG